MLTSLARRLDNTTRSSASRRRPRSPLFLEPLEERLVLSNDILWMNKSLDGFDQNYGGQAALARSVVEQAISDWRTVVTDFGNARYPFFLPPGFIDVPYGLQLVITAGDLGDGDRGVTTVVTTDLTGKPTSAVITLDDDGGGDGWNFGSAPRNEANFTDVKALFAGVDPNATGFDFYRTVAHEIGHALGLLTGDFRLRLPNALQDLNMADPNDSDGDLSLYQGPTVTATFTSVGGGHVFEGPGSPGVPSHPWDLLNAGRSIGLGTHELISDLDVDLLHDVYGYTVVHPSTLKGMNYAAVHDHDTGELTLNGDLGSSVNDTITIRRFGNQIVVNVIGYDWYYDIDTVSAIKVLGRAGADTVTVDLTGGNPLAQAALTVDGGDGTDTVKLVGTSVSETFTLEGATLSFTSGASSVLQLSNVENLSVDAAGGTDFLTVESTDGSIQQVQFEAGKGADTLTVEAAAAATTVVLEGGAGNDTLAVGSLTSGLAGVFGPVVVSGGDGNDTLTARDQATVQDVDYELTTDQLTWFLPGAASPSGQVTFDTLEKLTLLAGAGTNQLHVLSMPGVDSSLFDGGGGTDTLEAPDSSNVWDVLDLNKGTLNKTLTYHRVENLLGGEGIDRFYIHRGGIQTGTVDGSGAPTREGRPRGNTLDYSKDFGPVVVNLQTGEATQTGGFLNIDGFVGSPQSDTLIGQEVENVWNITGNNAGNVNGQFAFAGFENLTGGSRTDVFAFSAGKGVSGTVAGGGDTDTLDYSAYTTTATVNLQTSTATGTGGFTGIEGMAGGSAKDTLVGKGTLSGVNVWSLASMDAGTFQGAVTFTFSGTENLVGDANADWFVLAAGAGSTGMLDGAGGANQLSHAAYASPVVLNLATKKATNVNAFNAIGRFVGGAGWDTLVGTNTLNQFTVDSLDAGQVNTVSLGVLAFESFENLTGGPSTDLFQFAPLGHLSGSIKGMGGTDTLDHSLLPATMPVFVNLAGGVASRAGGSISAIENVTGGAGHDVILGDTKPNTLLGGDGHDVLVGGDGVDVLDGGLGNDLLIGGTGNDVITGGFGDDLLIGGTTAFDNNTSALLSLMAEWKSNFSYEVRRQHLLGQPGGSNGSYSLLGTVFEDPQTSDSLTGGAGNDWFWGLTTEIIDLDLLEKVGLQP